jgi:hypothetical protein
VKTIQHQIQKRVNASIKRISCFFLSVFAVQSMCSHGYSERVLILIKLSRTQNRYQKRYCDIWLCVCQKANEDDVRAVVGRGFYVLRGSEFMEFLQNIGITKQNFIDPTSEQMEA